MKADPFGERPPPMKIDPETGKGVWLLLGATGMLGAFSQLILHHYLPALFIFALACVPWGRWLLDRFGAARKPADA